MAGGAQSREKKPRSYPDRTAEQPGQTFNVDLCFVPVSHNPQVKLPAVSGSSGRLVVERAKPEADQQHWPGQVFTDPGLDYEKAMQAYVAATRERLSLTRTEKVVKGRQKSEQQALLREDQTLREERYRVRERPKQEDAVWRTFRKQFIVEQQAFRALAKVKRHKQRKAREAMAQRWQTARAQWQASLQVRPQDDVE